MTSIQALYVQQLIPTQPLEHIKTIDSYLAELRAALDILYNLNDFSGFVESMQFAIERNLTDAWIAGAAACGVLEQEISDAEVSELFGLILRDFSFIAGLGADVVTGREQGAMLENFFPRLDIWANRWNETFNLAKSIACADQKQIWILGATRKHCASCAGLAGKVKRASQWFASGVLPQSRVLECGGFRCQCRLDDTDEPLSMGKIPTTGIGVTVGGIVAGTAAVAAAGVIAALARDQIVHLISGTSIGDNFIELETGHGIKFGERIMITEDGRTYEGTAFATGPNIVEVAPPLNFAFSINAVVRHTAR